MTAYGEHNPNRNFVRRDSHSILQGGWLPPTASEQLDGSTSSGCCPLDTDIQARYVNYPLVRDMILAEDRRTAALEADGAKQMSYTKSNDGWFATLFVFEGRAFGRYNGILLVVTLNAVVWTVFAEFFVPEQNSDEVQAYENFFSLILSTTLAFLLVFRLNQSNERFWQARKAWGSVLALGRSLASGTVIHGSFDPTNRDAVVRWTAAFVLATMFFIRGERKMIHDAYAGILNEDQIKKLQRATHPPIHAGDNVRWHLHQLFTVSGSESVSFSVAQERIQQLSTLEHQLIALQDDLGALERIKATPLPLVYVTHLRTWLVLFLFSMPFIWQSSLGWATIPVVFLTSFAMLGLEGAAVEMESPWTHRTNHLSMDAYCLLLLSNIQQIIQEDADRRMDITLPQFLRSWRKGSEQPPLSPGAKLDLSDSSLSVASYQHNPLKNGMSSAPKLETIEGHLGDSYASIDTVDC